MVPVRGSGGGISIDFSKTLFLFTEVFRDVCRRLFCFLKLPLKDGARTGVSGTVGESKSSASDAKCRLLPEGAEGSIPSSIWGDSQVGLDGSKAVE